MVNMDRHGLEMSETSVEGVRHYERALDALLFLRPEVATESAAASAASPMSPMAQVFAAYLGCLGTESLHVDQAREEMEAYLPGPGEVTDREAMHLAAARAWIRGNLLLASTVLQEIVAAHPLDALALAVGHQLDFFTGDAVGLRDRVGGVLSAWDDQDPHYGLLLGMSAFGLEEAGHYDRSEDVGLAAVAANPRDVWAIHAVVHTYEMQGRFADGIRFMDARTEHWSSGNYLNVHNWWHYGLYSIEAGAHDRALAVYDAVLHNARSEGLAMELLDASALLWRLYLEGDTQPTRWAVLADAWAARADRAYYAFNDAHAVMAYVGAGRIADAETLITDRERSAALAREGVTNVGMTTAVGLAVCRALVAFGRERYADVVELLVPIRRRLSHFGGSHAQRDAIQKTLVEASLRAGRHELTRTLLSERVNLRPSSPYNRLKQAELADALGLSDDAAIARDRAATHTATIRAAWGR